MAIYLKKFETQAAYEAAQSGLILPNVSLTVDNNTVHYNPSTPVPPTPSHDYVDLGLPSGTLWAKYNVGATSETEYGNYYQYGKGADDYSVTSGQSDYSGTEDPLATSADTAAQVWGGSWHMPTLTQLRELTANTTYQWVSNYQNSGINGCTFTANNQTLFLPASGGWFDGTHYGLGEVCDYWCGTPSSDTNAYMLYSDENDFTEDGDQRNYGFSIRPVMDA